MRHRGRRLFTRRIMQNLILVAGGVLLYMGLSHLPAVASAFGWLLSIFTPFIAGGAIAYMLNMPMRFLERTVLGKVRAKRALAILITYAAAFLLAALLIGLVLPQLIGSVRTLLGNMNSYLDNLNAFVKGLGERFGIAQENISGFMLSYSDLLSRATALVREALPDILNAGMRVGSGIVGALTAFIASIYMLSGKEKLLCQCRRVMYALLSEKRAEGIMRVGRLCNGVFSGFISGKLLDSAIIGGICFVFMSLMNILSGIFSAPGIRMPYAPLISVVVGLTNIIPFFGPFIGAIPSIMILLMINPWSAAWFTVFVVLLQQFDGNLLGPKILGESTGLPPLWVLVSIIVGGGLFGFLGMLLGVPGAAVLYTLASDFIENRLRRRSAGGDGAMK